MCVVSLSIQSSVELRINNQCLNVNLVSPIHITGYRSEYYSAPGHRVYAGDAMRSGFIIDKSGNASYGALIYRLQRRQSHESTEIGKDTSSAAQLLVVWIISEFRPYVDVLLVEHDKRFDWDKDNLKKFYDKNINHFRLFPDSATETWSLDGNVALITTSEIMNEGHLLNIVISEVERDNCVRVPARIDLER
jgi:hypothetical protein